MFSVFVFVFSILISLEIKYFSIYRTYICAFICTLAFENILGTIVFLDLKPVVFEVGYYKKESIENGICFSNVTVIGVFEASILQWILDKLVNSTSGVGTGNWEGGCHTLFTIFTKRKFAYFINLFVYLFRRVSQRYFIQPSSKLLTNTFSQIY